LALPATISKNHEKRSIFHEPQPHAKALLIRIFLSQTGAKLPRECILREKANKSPARPHKGCLALKSAKSCLIPLVRQPGEQLGSAQ